jgi:hypothetical protein
VSSEQIFTLASYLIADERNLVIQSTVIKTVGFFGITNKLIKLSSQLISKPLTDIVSKSLIMGVYPERLKYAVIKPVLKKGEKIDMSNYRPISVVTEFAEIFDMVIFKRLNDHIVTRKILSSQQYGF